MNCVNPFWIEPGDQPIQVPCGKCLPCLVNRREEWAFRIWQEHMASCGSLFVTLTYDPQHLPDGYQLSKPDLQKFMKRLRKRCSQRLRYYAVGEYGTKRQRPHYHILLFNTTLDDEQAIRESWKLGQLHIGKVNEASIRYCLKYIVQPEQKTNRVKPFALIS